MQRTLPGVLSPCYIMAFIRLWYTESWKTDLHVPFLSQAETATRLLLLLVVDISGAGQSLRFSLRPLSSPQSFWLSVTASVILKQYALLGILWAYPIHCPINFSSATVKVLGRRCLSATKPLADHKQGNQLSDEEKVCLIDEKEREKHACALKLWCWNSYGQKPRKGDTR